MIATIFDIDGTLVDCNYTDGKLFGDAIRQVLGDVNIRDNWDQYIHVTDAGILDEIMVDNNINNPDKITDIKNAFSVLINQYLHNGSICNPIDGAIEFMNDLHANGSFSIGYATGGWHPTALAKLSHAGFNTSFALSSSDDSHIRTEIMINCLKKLGTEFDKVFYFGDGIWDIKATDDLGWDFIGIGPSVEGKCRYWFKDFLSGSELEKILHSV